MLLAMVLPGGLVLIYFVLATPFPVAVQQAAYVVGKVVQFGFPLVWVLGFQRARLGWKKPGRAGLWDGLVSGAAISAAMLALYYAWLKPAGHLEAAHEPICERLAGYGLTTPVRYALFGLFVSLAHSFLEEYYWRWFTFGGLRRLVPLWAAIGLSSVGFMLHHVVVLSTYFGWASLPTVLFSLAVAVGGGIWAWIYHHSGSLYGPWLSHLCVDVAIFVVGYDLVGHYFAP